MDYKPTEKLFKTLLGCGDLDFEVLEKFLNYAEHFDINTHEIVDRIEKPQTNISFNSIIYATISVVFKKVMVIAEMSADRCVENSTELKEEIEKIRNEFDPHIDYYHSNFNNCLDSIDLNSLPTYPCIQYVKIIRKW